MKNELLIKGGVILVCAIIIGSAMCLPLYKWKIKSFLKSSLWIKIIWWIPIYLILVSIILFKTPFVVIISAIIFSFALKEFFNKTHNNKSNIAIFYLLFFITATTHFILLFLFFYDIAPQTIAIVFLLSVFSDVVAYFFGTYMPKHRLPKWINQNKSWEGVIGQILGSFVGLLVLIIFLGMNCSWWLVLLIGSASAIGDLFNSIAKRSLNIKDWGKTIPGHGGVLDRMSSLSTAMCITFWILFFC